MNPSTPPLHSSRQPHNSFRGSLGGLAKPRQHLPPPRLRAHHPDLRNLGGATPHGGQDVCREWNFRAAASAEPFTLARRPHPGSTQLTSPQIPVNLRPVKATFSLFHLGASPPPIRYNHGLSSF
jgi:hypothetical protein